MTPSLKRFLSRRLLAVALLSLAYTGASAQSSWGLLFGPRLNINTINTESGSVLSGLNTLSGSLGIVYDLRLKGGWLVEAGAEYGVQKEKLNTLLSLGQFDPNAQHSLKDVRLDYTETFRLRYAALRVASGHSFRLRPRYHLDVVAGMSLRWYFDSHRARQAFDLVYADDQGQRYMVLGFYERAQSLGSTPMDQTFTKPIFQFHPMYELRTQVRREIRSYVFNEISAGIRISVAHGQQGFIRDRYVSQLDGGWNLAHYYARNLGVQLTLGAGF